MASLPRACEGVEESAARELLLASKGVRVFGMNLFTPPWAIHQPELWKNQRFPYAMSTHHNQQRYVYRGVLRGHLASVKAV